MQYVTKINNILADAIRGKKGDEQYSVAHANRDIHETFNGGLESEIISFKNEDGEMTAIDYLLNECCIEYGIKLDDIKGKSRKRECVEPRQIAMYLLEKHKAGSLKSIGSRFNGRDHSTVIHSKRAVNDLLETDELYGRKVKRIEDNLMNFMGKNETILSTSVVERPIFNVRILKDEIKAIMRKSPLVTDREILNNYKIERNTCDKILKLIEKIEAISMLQVATEKESEKPIKPEPIERLKQAINS